MRTLSVARFKLTSMKNRTVTTSPGTKPLPFFFFCSSFFLLRYKKTCRKTRLRRFCLSPASPTPWGVRVRVSTVLLDKLGGVQEPVFAYSVRMDLLSVEEQMRRWAAAAAADASAVDLAGDTNDGNATPFFKPLISAQLKDRLWIITDCNGKKDEVRGEAVIGEYPLLIAAKNEVESPPPFVYQSCTECEVPGTMEGGFTFVEGSIARPTGPEFFVRCPLFRLERPEYVFQ